MSLNFIVTRWPQENNPHSGTETSEVIARSHREALEHSGLKAPAARFSVSLVGESTIRYQIDSRGRVSEQSYYGLHPAMSRSCAR